MVVNSPGGPAPLRVDLRRVGGILGIAWIVLFIVGVIVLQGDTPSRDDSVAEIREYFADDGEKYLLGDFLIGVGFTLFFLPFIVVLRRQLSATADPLAQLLSRVSLYAGIIALIWGGIAGFFWGALALSGDDQRLDDASVRMLMEIDAYAFAGLLLPIGLFMGSAGASILMSGVMWRWIGVLGIVGFVGSYIGALWPLDGDDEGALAGIGVAGFIGILVFVLAISLNMLMRPAPDRNVAADRTAATS